MTWTRQASLIARRDVGVEAAGREAAVAVLPFVLAALVLGGLGFGPDPARLAAVAPGLVWLVVLIAAVPLARGVAAAEREDGCWDLLRSQVRPSALLAGKVAVLWAWLALSWLAAAALAAAALGAPLTAAAAAGGILGTAGLAAVTTVFGVLLADSAQRGGLLAVLVLPVALPALLAGVQAATPGVDALPWLAVLAAYDALAITVAWAVFPALLEE